MADFSIIRFVKKCTQWSFLLICSYYSLIACCFTLFLICLPVNTMLYLVFKSMISIIEAIQIYINFSGYWVLVHWRLGQKNGIVLNGPTLSHILRPIKHWFHNFNYIVNFLASLRKGSVTSPTNTIVTLHWLKMHCIPHKIVSVFL